MGPADENLAGGPTNGYVDDQGTLDLYGNLREVPLLLWYGSNDELVPVAGALNIAQALRSAGVEHEVDIFPGMDHFSLSLIDEWDRGGDWLTTPPIDRSPSRIGFTTKPGLAMTIDLERAGIAEGAFTLELSADQPLDITLTGYGRTMSLIDVGPGVQDLFF